MTYAEFESRTSWIDQQLAELKKSLAKEIEKGDRLYRYSVMCAEVLCSYKVNTVDLVVWLQDHRIPVPWLRWSADHLRQRLMKRIFLYWDERR